MNFVRFLKLPKSDGQRSPTCSAVFTIQSTFSLLSDEEDLFLSLHIVETQSNHDHVSQAKLVHPLRWKGSGPQKIKFQIPEALRKYEHICIRIGPEIGNEKSFEKKMEASRALCSYIGSMQEYICPAWSSIQDSVTALRLPFRVFQGSISQLKILENAGDTIACHVWDAAVYQGAMISADFEMTGPLLSDYITDIRQRLSVAKCILDLGCGCGSLGLSISKMFPHISTILLTDTVEPKSIVDANARLNETMPVEKQNVRFRELEWTTRPLPSWILDICLDVVLLSDVTYNESYFEPLVYVMKQLPCKTFLLSHRRRHENEAHIYDLLRESGFRIARGIMLQTDSKQGTISTLPMVESDVCPPKNCDIIKLCIIEK